MSLPCDNDHFDGWHNGWGNGHYSGLTARTEFETRRT